MDSPVAAEAKTDEVIVSTPSPSPVPTPTVDKGDANNEFDPSISEDERRFYLKAYSSVDLVRERKVHCTVCKTHIGCAPSQESSIKMHPVLRVTHCMKCHDFYNSGEFSKGEDGSELYCRWCGQGGEVYCCSNCPYVFCKSCIVKNLSRGVVADIEQNENWSCFSCAPKILWPLRAQHWALVKYIEKQKKSIQEMNLPESEFKQMMNKDRSTCCRLAKAKAGHMSDSLESLESSASRRSHGSNSSTKKSKSSLPPGQMPPAKRAKTSNDEVVCTPDLMSMLEPDCQITVSPKPRPMKSPANSTPKVISIHSNYGAAPLQHRSNVPPPLVLRNTSIQMRPVAPSPVVRRTIVGSRTPTPGGTTTPVYHTINGYRIDLNSAAQQETFRLPNGKLIQVKRQGTQHGSTPSSPNIWQPQARSSLSMQNHPPSVRSIQITQASGAQSPYQTFTIQQPGAIAGQQTQSQPSSMVQYHNTTIAPLVRNGVQISNGSQSSATQMSMQAGAGGGSGAQIRPVMLRHVFPDTAIGKARTQLQEQVFNAMEICTHLTGKVQTLTNSNAYKQARNYLEIKELYIHLSYLLTYAIGRFKGLQDKCLTDMRQLGFSNDADSLENGQLAAGVDYVRYGQLEDVELFNTGSNSFHNQIYEYRKSLHANLEDDEDGAKEPLSPLIQLGEFNMGSDNENDNNDNDNEDGDDCKWQTENESYLNPYRKEIDENDEPDETLLDDEAIDDSGAFNNTNDYDDYDLNVKVRRNPENYMRRETELHNNDRKLIKLVEQYPSIWCTRHPDYGNFEVTRRQWRTIQSHFKRSINIKLRWKNIRKRYVRIERRMREGKRFNGFYDKATNFLSNRDLPVHQWRPIDRGDSEPIRKYDDVDMMSLRTYEKRREAQKRTSDYREPTKPVEIRPIDLKIINFVKSNPILWRKTIDPICNKSDEQARRSLWMHLWKSMPSFNCEDIIDRWVHLYEMYKAFRLKTIKDGSILANLELKYSKYLAKLYFLYKIDEEDLKNEDLAVEDMANIKEEAVVETDTKLQDMPDDNEFVFELVRVVRQYTELWDKLHVDYYDTILRDRLWNEVYEKLKDYKHKQASDDEDNEIEIVEPKTDTILLDSDNEDESSTSALTSITTTSKESLSASTSHTSTVSQNNTITTTSMGGAGPPSVTTVINNFGTVAAAPPDTHDEYLSLTHNFLASLLEVDLNEGNDQQHTSAQYSPNGTSVFGVGGIGGNSNDASTLKKQPRKKTTFKPNPTLLKQKQMLERERMEEMKRCDVKLKMQCAVQLKKAEDEYPFAKDLLQKSKEEGEMNIETNENGTKESETDTQMNTSTTSEDSSKTEVFVVEVQLDDDLKQPQNGGNTDDKTVGDGDDKACVNQTKQNGEKIVVEITEIEANTQTNDNNKEEIQTSELKSKDDAEDKVDGIVDDDDVEMKDCDQIKENGIVLETDIESKSVGEVSSTTKQINDVENIESVNLTPSIAQSGAAPDDDDIELIEVEEPPVADENAIANEEVQVVENALSKEESCETLSESPTTDNAQDSAMEGITDMKLQLNGETEINVDEEIEKLLQNNKNINILSETKTPITSPTTSIPDSNTAAVESADIVDTTKALNTPAETNAAATTATTTSVEAAENATVGSTSPELLFNDINELIAKENNAETT